MPQTRQAQIEYLIIAGLFLLALFSFGRMVSKMIDPAFGGLDLHAIWHSGHALRQDEDPLRFALERRAPDLPVTYLDGTVTAEPRLVVTAADGANVIDAETSDLKQTWQRTFDW